MLLSSINIRLNIKGHTALFQQITLNDMYYINDVNVFYLNKLIH